jgi:hypothetical protein
LNTSFHSARKQWLQTFLDLRHGIPTRDTLGRVFGAMDPTALAKAFRRWAAMSAAWNEDFLLKVPLAHPDVG